VLFWGRVVNAIISGSVMGSCWFELGRYFDSDWGPGGRVANDEVPHVHLGPAYGVIVWSMLSNLIGCWGLGRGWVTRCRGCS